MYSKKVMEHFQNPHNYGKIENPDGIGKVGNPRCGDIMYLYIKVENDIITDIKFETMGCAAAIATSSVVTDLAKGKNILEALKLNSQNVVDALEGLPVIKVHCSLLAADALAEAVYDYLKKNRREIPNDLEEKHAKINKEHGE
ncbi:MAG: iron-sulfur cluster assembly scaffold protein [bacterium]|nr:iron-sulfur cluster assembly scaffold protein [bacterium]